MTPWFGMALDAATLVLLVSFSVSVVLALGAKVYGGATPIMAERLAWWRVIAPPLSGFIAVFLAFASACWDAWRATPDHCGGTAAHQPYLCWPHPAGAAAASAPELLAVGALAMVVLIALARLTAWWLASRRIAALAAQGHPADAAAFRAALMRGGGRWRGPITVLRTEAPICCVTGILTPRLLVSTALAARLSPADLTVIVAHERAHLDRGDLPRRLVAHLLAGMHAPGLGQTAVADWTLKAELACDRAAAIATGSSLKVAETLVRYRRAFPSGMAPIQDARGLASFSGAGELETRVRALLGERRHKDGPQVPAPLIWLFIAATLVVTPGLHHALEAVLRLLHR